MKHSFHYAFILLLLAALFVTGCGSSDSSSPASPASEGTARIEGQLVAEVDTQAAKLQSAIQGRAATSSATQVYPLSEVTVQLIQNGSVIATAITDEYGRFQFPGLPSGDYEVQAISDDGGIANYHVSVNDDQTLTVYGRVMSGTCQWNQASGPHWEDMQQGANWEQGFCGASPGQGYWHNGQGWQNGGAGQQNGGGGGAGQQNGGGGGGPRW